MKEDGSTETVKKDENGKERKYDKIHSWHFKIVVSVQEKQK